MEQQGEPQIQIGENGLSATLILPKVFDRAGLTVAVCQSLLKDAGVDLESTSQELTESLIAEAQAAEPGRFQGVIARGTPAVHGKDAYIEWKIAEGDEPPPDAPNEQAQAGPQAEAHGAVSFYNRSVFTIVKAGDVLGEVHREVPGTEGKDVRGKELATRTAKPLEFQFDETIGVDQHHKIVAKASGVLIRNHRTAQISDTIEVEQNVDFNTGNIVFNGNILVKRGAKDCFVVQATENVEVRGLIEAATIIAGKDLHAKGGFAGREQGVAKVQGNLYAKYLDAVELHVGGDLCVDREVINCQTTVLGDINCPRGAIIGGVTQMSGSVDLLDLGAGAQPMTELYVGVLPQLDPLIDRLTAISNELIDARQKLLDEQEMIVSNSGAKIAPTNQEKLNKIDHELARVQGQLDRAEPALQQARDRAEELRRVEVKINRKLHPNVVLVFGSFRYRLVNELKGPIRVSVNKRGQLMYARGEARPALLSVECDLRVAA